MEFEELSRAVIGAALRVHSALGPGLFENVYKTCLKHELVKSGMDVLSEVLLPVTYDNIQLEIGYRLDLLVENTLILELKSVESVTEIHKAQLLTYLKLSGKQLGLLFNFNTAHLQHGIRRVINSPPSFPSRPPRYTKKINNFPLSSRIKSLS